MKKNLLIRRLFRKIENSFQPVEIFITIPLSNIESQKKIHVQFSGASQYNRDILGLDLFNSLECSLAYIDGICKNSVDPKFYWADGEPYFESGMI